MTDADHLGNAAHRAAALIDVRNCLKDALDASTEASEKAHAVWDDWPTSYRNKPNQIDAAGMMLQLVMDNVTEDIMAAAVQAATLLARDITEDARQSVNPVCFITGNSMMPPLRELHAAEIIWQTDQAGDVWERFHEALEHHLQEHKVLMASPEYDNALYVVDLVRWMPSDAEDPDDLNDEWTEAPF
jgi:hypothetical protein